MAAAQLGGRQVFRLTQSPVEKLIRSHLGDLSIRATFARTLAGALADGGRAAVVYPKVDAGDEDAANVINGARALESAFPGKVAVLHSRLTDAEIRASLDRVRAGETPLLVASVLIETGIDIPSMRALIVRDAHCFGAAQLHQLRGRLARNGGEADFMMMVPDMAALDEETLVRLEMVRDVNNGHEIAERDMQLRGFGDQGGDSQSGQARTVFRLLRLGPDDFLRRVALDGAELEQRSGRQLVLGGSEAPEQSVVRGPSRGQAQPPVADVRAMPVVRTTPVDGGQDQHEPIGAGPLLLRPVTPARSLSASPVFSPRWTRHPGLAPWGKDGRSLGGHPVAPAAADMVTTLKTSHSAGASNAAQPASPRAIQQDAAHSQERPIGALPSVSKRKILASRLRQAALGFTAGSAADELQPIDSERAADRPRAASA